MAARWRTQTTNLQSIVVEACWRPMEGDVAGDFYDVIDLKDGRMAVVIGDAPGFGRRAAALADELLGEVRRAFRETSDANVVLARLDERMRAAGDDLIATAACAVIDPETRSLHVTSAGHLPLLIASDLEVSFLDGRPDPPLGVEAERRSETHRLSASGTLFLYTDGLIERRGTSLADSLEVLLEATHGLTGATAWASELARRATSWLGEPADDATVISVRLLPAGSRSAELAAPARPLVRQRVALQVYVDPCDLRSAQTEAVLRDLVQRLGDRLDVHLEVVDVTAADANSETHGVIATPTVVRVSPGPPVRVIGAPGSVVDLARQLQLPLPREDH